LLNPGVFAQVVDEINRIGNMLLYIFGVPVSVLNARNVVFGCSCEIVIKRDDPMPERMKALT
jgi:hypothetical protein